MIDAKDIQTATKFVTKEWTRQRKAEEHGRPRAYREYVYSDRVNFTDVAWRILPDAYKHASGNFEYPVAKRQLFYACREAFRKRTKRPLEYSYFANDLLTKYMNQHPDETAAWRITADPRGALIIPNAGFVVRIPCGTLQIDSHLDRAAEEVDPLDVYASIKTRWPSLAGGQRYQGVLYIEKEGFGPILEKARIAERFDLAIISCKGQSVVAARKYVDTVCAMDGGVPLYVAHDFDKYGFEISQRLTTVSESARDADRVKYEFQNEINVTDLGLRLSDVEQYELISEEVEFKGRFAPDSICTKEEKDFLRSGRRVELNMFTSPQLIEWLEARLTSHGMGKRLIPGDEVLEDAYHRAMIVATINNAIDEVTGEAVDEYEDMDVPKTLRRKLKAAMKDQDKPWDAVLYDLASEKVKTASTSTGKKQAKSALRQQDGPKT